MRSDCDFFILPYGGRNNFDEMTFYDASDNVLHTMDASDVSIAPTSITLTPNLINAIVGKEKTVTVAIELQFPHPKYLKIVKKTRKLHAHDDTFDAKVGDTVKIMETKPYSKSKRWRVTEIVERAR